MPWLTADGGHSAAEAVKVEDMMLVVDTMLENTAADDEKVEFSIFLHKSSNIIVFSRSKTHSSTDCSRSGISF